MRIKKNNEIVKLEEALKKAKEKQQEDIKKINIKFTEIILKKLYKDEFFKKELKEILSKYNLDNAIDLLNKNYNSFEIKDTNKTNI